VVVEQRFHNRDIHLLYPTHLHLNFLHVLSLVLGFVCGIFKLLRLLFKEEA
jgi:hypothetical protein